MHPNAATMARRVSIVIPCYQQAHFLAEAIESALAQSYRPLDVTVVDDGSTDTTAEIVAGYPDVRGLRQRNQGIAAARNAGWRASRAPYVIFLDSDDRLLPRAAEAGVAALDADPAAAFAVGRHRRIAADGTPLRTPVRAPIVEDHYVSLVRRCWITVPEVMYRRSALKVVGGYDRRLRYAEDYDLYLRLARRFPIVAHAAEVAEYRQHPGTLSRDVEEMLAATLAVLAPHRPGTGATPALRDAWRERANAVWYFQRLFEAGLHDVASGAWLSAAYRFAIFTRHLPRHPAYARRCARALVGRLRALTPAAAP